MVVGLIGLAILVAGHFGSYTFIRVAAEGVRGVTPATIAILLAVYGVGGLLGNLLAGLAVDRHLGIAMTVIPLIIAAAIIEISLSTGSVTLVFAAVAVWGIGFGAIPTMSQTWVSRAEPDRVEAAGGLFVATFQLAHRALGRPSAASLLDTTGVGAVYLAGGIGVLAGGALMLSTRRRLSR